MPNAKYLAFGTPNTKNQSSSGTSNLKHFTTPLQYRLKYEMIWTSMPKKKICLFYLLFSLLPTHISLSSSATSLLSGLHLSRCSLFLSHSHFFFFISNSLPLSSSLYSADFKPLSCCRSRLEQPPADLVLTLLRHTSPISLSLSLSLSLDVWLF